MTATERARRPDALYRDSGISRRGLCDRIVLLEHDLSEREATREVVRDGNTDGATGYCRCGSCGRAVDLFDRYCRHCGSRLVDGQTQAGANKRKGVR